MRKNTETLQFSYKYWLFTSLFIVTLILFSSPGFSWGGFSFYGGSGPDQVAVSVNSAPAAPVYPNGYYNRGGYRWAPYHRVAPRGARVLYYTRNGRPVYRCQARANGVYYVGRSIAGGPCRILVGKRRVYENAFSIHVN